MKQVGYGIIGAGNIAALHAKAFSALTNDALVDVYDRNTAAAKRLAEEYGCEFCPDFRTFLADSRIQAVTIATPSGMHGAAAIPSAEAGKHVFCEKPLDITLEKADAIIQACDENGVLLSPVFQSRFTRPVQLVKDAMKKGRFGRMVLASAQVRWFRDAAYYSSSDWRGTWKLDGGGALMNQSIHAVDMLLYINGAPEEVFAFAGTLSHSIEVEDNLCAAVKYRNGSFGTIEVSTSCAPGFPRRIEFSGSGGTVAFEEERITRWEFVKRLPEDEEIMKELALAGDAAGGRSPMNIADTGHRLQLEDFSDAILNHREPRLTGREGRRAIELICGIYESAKTGKPFFFI